MFFNNNQLVINKFKNEFDIYAANNFDDIDKYLIENDIYISKCCSFDND
jgi:hypothetical protein